MIMVYQLGEISQGFIKFVNEIHKDSENLILFFYCENLHAVKCADLTCDRSVSLTNAHARVTRTLDKIFSSLQKVPCASSQSAPLPPRQPLFCLL